MKQMKWEITFENDFWKAEGKTFFPNEWAKNKVKHFIKTQRKELLDSIKEEIEHLWTKPNYQLGGNYENDEHYNQALSEVLKIIKIKQ